MTFPSALDASDRVARAMLRAAGLESEDFTKRLPSPNVIRNVEPAAVLPFPASAEAT